MKKQVSNEISLFIHKTPKNIKKTLVSLIYIYTILNAIIIYK